MIYRTSLYCFSIAGLLSLGLFVLSYAFQFSDLYFFLAQFGMLSSGVILIAILFSIWLIGKDRTNAFLLNIFLLTTTLFIVLLISEIAVRYIFKDITTTGDNTSYFARKWNKKNVKLNSMGFRETEFNLQKPKDYYRISFIGDSFTFGQGIEEDHRFSNLIGQYLVGKGAYQVLNFGTPGAETVDHIATFKKSVLPAQPDFVILQWFMNDFEGKDKSQRPKRLPLLPSPYIRSGLHRYSALYYLVNNRWNSFQLAFGPNETYAEYMHRRFKDSNSADSVLAVSEMREFIHECKAEKIGIGIVLFPSFSYGQQFAYLQQRVKDLCDLEGITCIDLSLVFDKYPDPFQLWVNRFDRHPGVVANKLAADRIWETFLQIWLSQNEG